MRQTVAWLKFMFKMLKYDVLTTTGDDDPDERVVTLAKFRFGPDRILVATNMVARGIDVPSVKLVLNFVMPVKQGGSGIDSKTFIHRIGRAGHFGNIDGLFESYK